jgi:hypothetical protein
MEYLVAEDWPWTHPSYELAVPVSMDNIESIVIDPTGRIADVDRANNSKEFE